MNHISETIIRNISDSSVPLAFLEAWVDLGLEHGWRPTKDIADDVRVSALYRQLADSTQDLHAQHRLLCKAYSWAEDRAIAKQLRRRLDDLSLRLDKPE